MSLRVVEQLEVLAKPPPSSFTSSIVDTILQYSTSRYNCTTSFCETQWKVSCSSVRVQCFFLWNTLLLPAEQSSLSPPVRASRVQMVCVYTALKPASCPKHQFTREAHCTLYTGYQWYHRSMCFTYLHCTLQTAACTFGSLYIWDGIRCTLFTVQIELDSVHMNVGRGSIPWLLVF